MGFLFSFMVEGGKMEKTKSLLTEPLGLFGWKTLEPVILAALATELPMLLVGKHGSAKSFLLERLAESLNLNFRSYNASLINYDDLVGIPIPANNNTTLEYISNPNSIWDAEVVFIDEINRTKPEFQNKLFPIIYDKRVQGQKLEKLKYRWAAMNPPFLDEEEDNLIYFGAMPLDPALADRFPFIIEVPEWDSLSKEDKKSMLYDADKGRHEFPVDIKELVDKARAKIKEISISEQENISNYILALMDVLKGSLGYVSARRATMFQETLIAIYASMIVLGEYTGDVSTLDDSVYLHIQTSLPFIVNQRIDRGLLLTIAARSLKIAQTGDEITRELLLTTDPLKQIKFAVVNRIAIKAETLSEVITSSISQLPSHRRRAVALISYLVFKENEDIYATAIETLVAEVRPVFETRKVDTMEEASIKALADHIDTLMNGVDKNEKYYKYLNNLLYSFLLPRTSQSFYSNEEIDILFHFFIEIWKEFVE
jgi:MoxR-like ATPase